MTPYAHLRKRPFQNQCCALGHRSARWFAVLMLISKLLFTTSPDTEAQWIERETIRQCWKELERKPEDDKPKHFAGKEDCGRLEFDFKARWNPNP